MYPSLLASCYIPVDNVIFLAWSVDGKWGRGAGIFEIKEYSQIYSWFGCFVAVAECAMKCIEILHICTLITHAPLFSLRAVNTPDRHTSAGLAHRAGCTRLPFLVLSVHSWVWIAELAAILYGVTIKLFLTLFYGETVGWVRRKLNAYTSLKILEVSCDRIQQIIIKYKPEPELPLSSVSSSTKLSGIWDSL